MLQKTLQFRSFVEAFAAHADKAVDIFRIRHGKARTNLEGLFEFVKVDDAVQLVIVQFVENGPFYLPVRNGSLFIETDGLTYWEEN